MKRRKKKTEYRMVSKYRAKEENKLKKKRRNTVSKKDTENETQIISDEGAIKR